MDDITDPDTDDPRLAAPQGGDDDRKTAVDPASDPHPVNPPTDEDAMEKGQDTLGRVKPY